MSSPEVLEQLQRIDDTVRREFEAERRVLSFEEYLEQFAKDPIRHSRDAVAYVRDAFDHFGKTPVQMPWGETSRFALFDLPWLDPEEAERMRLVGQEQIQQELYRVLANFAREGRANRLPLLHGPNGSAKSTVARCLMLALEHYSQLDEGALYRFHWVFPTRRVGRGNIGFGEKSEHGAPSTASYAHLDEEEIDARLIDEMRDHPLLLLPVAERRRLLVDFLGEDQLAQHTNRWLWQGSLAHKNRIVFDALLATEKGSLRRVLQHVQIERYFISRRYRIGAVTLGPELNVDAGERQVTADRSLAALPSSLQAVALYEAHGELLEASGGILEFSDLLKRPLDAFKYLQLTVETGEFSLPSQNVSVNCLMLASANEQELIAFRKHPEFESFRGRLELIKAPYLLDWQQEQLIYDAQVASQLRSHCAPHATAIAAMFAVLTRLMSPEPERYERDVRPLVRGLRALEKMDLYAMGKAPERLDADAAKTLRALVQQLHQEGVNRDIYEGCIGASPREMRTLLFDAAQDEHYFGLSPFAVLDALDRLCQRKTEFGWLQLEVEEGGYADHTEFRALLRQRLLSMIEDEFRQASGLVDESRYGQLFERYILHVSFWAKKEKLRNPVTGAYESPDEGLMTEVEDLLDLPDEQDSLRESWMNRIAAWAIEHPGERVDNGVVFADVIRRLRDRVFAQRRGALTKLTRDIVLLLSERGDELETAHAKAAREAVDRLVASFGYVDKSVYDAAVRLTKERFDAT